MKLEFHPEAELELIEAAVYYELQVPGLGGDFEAEIRRATDLLIRYPEMGHPVDPELRRFVLQRFPFALIYSVTPVVCALKSLRTKTGCPATGGLEWIADPCIWIQFADMET